MFPNIIMPDKKPRILPNPLPPKYSLSNDILVVTKNPHPRLKVMMKGTSSHIVSVVKYAKSSRPTLSKTKLAMNIA